MRCFVAAFLFFLSACAGSRIPETLTLCQEQQRILRVAKERMRLDGPNARLTRADAATIYGETLGAIYHQNRNHAKKYHFGWSVEEVIERSLKKIEECIRLGKR